MAQLEELFHLLKMERHIRVYLNSRFLTYLLAVMLQRCLRVAEVTFYSIGRKSLTYLFDTKCFRLLMFKMLEAPQSAGLVRFSQMLFSTGLAQLEHLQASQQTFAFYLYVILSCFKASDPSKLKICLETPGLFDSLGKHRVSF